MARPSGRALRDELLEATRPRIQSAGVGGFSYGDLAKELEIRSPSIHHHFPTKADLVGEVTSIYRADFAALVDAIDEPTAAARLHAYAQLFNKTSSAGLLCLCGAIAAEWPDISDRPRQEVEAFFADQQTWLTDQIAAGMHDGEFRTDIEAADGARVVLAALEGSVLMARPTRAPDLAALVGSVAVTLLAKP